MNQRSLWIEGVSDAIGFLGGALLGFWAGHLLGLDIFAPGYSNRTIGAILMVGMGGGLGLKLARRWRSTLAQKRDESR